MSIRNPEKKRAQEKKKRPDSMHRAVKFLLEQAKQNNRDITVEADHHLSTLDDELGNKKEIGPVVMPTAAAAATAPAPPAPAEPAQDTAALLRQSRRFRRNS
jgi:hypothetical protein